MKKIFVLAFFLLSGFCYAQQTKPGLLMDPTEIEENVHKELNDVFLQSKDLLKLKSKYPDAKGNVSLFVTVAGKGKVETVFKSDGDITSVAFSNQLQDLLKAYHFQFSLKKGMTCKVKHEFTF
ncbi:MAG: hypothetical protein V4714_09285 [Bacteroidota bacterium]